MPQKPVGHTHGNDRHFGKIMAKSLTGKNAGLGNLIRKAWYLICIGAPDRNRTCNLLIRSQVLYPIELRAHEIDWQVYSWIEVQEGPSLYRSFSFSVNSAGSINTAGIIKRLRPETCKQELYQTKRKEG